MHIAAPPVRSASRSSQPIRPSVGSRPASPSPPLTMARPAKRVQLRSPPRSTLCLFDRQRSQRINRRGIKQILKAILEGMAGSQAYELAVHLVSVPEITALNERFLRHRGATDVISFDYRTYALAGTALEPAADLALYGEIYLSVDAARHQGRQLGIPWPQELLRYLIHGLLHLQGYKDARPADRWRMRRMERKWLRYVDRRFPEWRIDGPASL